MKPKKDSKRTKLLLELKELQDIGVGSLYSKVTESDIRFSKFLDIIDSNEKYKAVATISLHFAEAYALKNVSDEDWSEYDRNIFGRVEKALIDLKLQDLLWY